MAIYQASLKCKTKTGGVEKQAQLMIKVEADSREEALIRMRSAAARVLSKPGTKDVGDHLMTTDDQGNTTGVVIPYQAPFSIGPSNLYTVHVGTDPVTGETLEQQQEVASKWEHGAVPIDSSLINLIKKKI